MHTVRRILPLLLLSGFIPTAQSLAFPAVAFKPLTRLDAAQARVAATLAGTSAFRAVTWLHHQERVGSVRLEPDRSTIHIQFRDGADVFVVPRTLRYTALPFTGQPRPQMQAGSGPGRAVVLEPFADELHLPADVGQVEADLLSSSGFKVDIFRNTDVTVALMAKLSTYSVVYMETHSGLLDGGDGMVVTGEKYSAADLPFYQDHTLQQALVAGDPTGTLYNGITGKFVSQHMSTFPLSSVVFFNGCSLLSAPALWTALHAKNVATMISWDHEVYNFVDELTARVVLSDLSKGDSVGGAVKAADSAGLATSIVQGVVAHLGFEGDDANTLPRALSGTFPSPTPTATATATRTAKPTVRPTVRATARPTAKPATRPKKHVIKCKRGWHAVHGKCRRIQHRKG